MKRIYVAGKYSAGNVIEVLQNIGKGRKACADLFNLGLAPFCPWHDASYATDLCYQKLPKRDFYQASTAWLKVSDAVFVISGKGDGGGVDAEIKIAEEMGLPVFDKIGDLVRWAAVPYDGEVMTEETVSYPRGESVGKSSIYHDIAKKAADLTVEKQEAYGDSFGKAPKFLEILYPDGIQPDQYPDMLALVRDFDKSMRIATKKDAFGENPWKDKLGYSLLSVAAGERV